MIPAQITAVTAGGATGWAGTQYRFDRVSEAQGTRQCVTAPGTGTTRTVNVTAPGLVQGAGGTYDARFWARSGSPPGCGGAESTPPAGYLLSQALRLVGPGPNPGLPPRCGINVMLVLDESGSILETPARPEVTQIRNASRALLDALSGTGSAVSIIEFNDRARRPVGYTTVTDDTIRDVFDPYLGPTPGRPPDQVFDPRNPVVNATNWHAALEEVSEANYQRPRADLVLFMTDGDPTAYNPESGSNPVTGLAFGHVEALKPAALQADDVKEEGSHILALGVGEAVTGPNSARRLTAISGPNRYPGTNFEEADYTLVEDFEDLAARFRQIVTELCEGSITITKLVDEGDGSGFRPAPGWNFTASVDTNPGGYTWVQPPPPPPSGPRTQTTGEDGTATFQWSPNNAEATSTVRISEDLRPGYVFDEADCGLTANGFKRPGPLVELPVLDEDLGPNDWVTCTVRNRRPAEPSATIRIIKDAVPDSRQVFDFTSAPPLGNVAEFALSDNDVPEPPTQRTFTVQAPGTYVVSEARPSPRWTLTAITCSDGFSGTGPAVSISVAPDERVSCKFTNVRRDQPTQPPPDPPPPPPDSPPTPEPPPPPALRPSTRLAVVKTATRVARVGDRVRFRLTVTNRGRVTARNVRVRDIPPGAVALASFRSSTRPRAVGRPGAIWRVRRLAPGASRTIRWSGVIRAGTPGRHRNFAYALAANARLVDDRADTRLLGRRTAPPVTG